MDDRFEQAKAHFFAALGRQQAGDLAEAERLYQASLGLVPGRASTLINLAAVQLRLGRPGDALASATASTRCCIAPPRWPSSAAPTRRWRRSSACSRSIATTPRRGAAAARCCAR